MLPPVPLDLTAVRDGDEVVVRWRTAKPASPSSYFVLGFTDDDEPVTGNEVSGTSKRTSFVARLPDTRRQVETVTVIRANQETFDTGRTSVKVRG